MKTLFKIVMSLLLISLPNFAQVVVAEPDAPPAIFWGNEKLTEKEEKEYLSKISNEQLKRELMEIKKLDEKKYFSLLRRTSLMSLPSIYSIGGNSEFMISGEREVSELRNKISELELYSEVLGVKYQEADQADKQKLASQLKSTLSDVFDLRESQRKEEVAKLEKKLSELKESIQIRSNNKEQIVDERFRTLTGKGKYLKWD